MKENHEFDSNLNNAAMDEIKVRKKYERPNLTVWGSVTDLTRTGHMYSTLDLNGNQVSIIDVGGSLVHDDLHFDDCPFPGQRHSNVFSRRMKGRHNKL